MTLSDAEIHYLQDGPSDTGTDRETFITVCKSVKGWMYDEDVGRFYVWNIDTRDPAIKRKSYITTPFVDVVAYELRYFGNTRDLRS